MKTCLSSVGPLCLGHLVWGRLLSFLCALVSFAFVVSFAKSLVPDWISALHMLFDVSSSLHLTLEDLSSQALGHFLGWMHLCCCYLGVSMGQNELRILLLCHPHRFPVFMFYFILYFLFLYFYFYVIYILLYILIFYLF